MFTLEHTEDVLEDLKALRATNRNHILDKIEEQLLHGPTQATRNKRAVREKPPHRTTEDVL